MRKSAGTVPLIVLFTFALTACAAQGRALEYELFPVADGAVSPEPLQRLTAAHEAAHVVAATLYFGDGFVEEVHIDVKCCGPAYHGHLGRTVPSRGVPLASAADHHRVMVMFLAGIAAERMLYGDVSTEEDHDVRQANMINRRRFGISEDVALTSAQREALWRAFDRAMVGAQAIVRVNRQTIIALAARLMAEPVIDHRRTLDAGDLRAFFATHPVRDPLARRP